MTRARYTAHESVSQGAVLLDGAQNVSIQYAKCCLPIPGDPVTGYIDRGEGLVVHAESCPVARRLYEKDVERFVTVAWADEPVRLFTTKIVVTVNDENGALARVASALARLDVGIMHLTMPNEDNQLALTKQPSNLLSESTALALNIYLIIRVKKLEQLASVLRTLRRTPSVLRAERVMGEVPQGKVEQRV
jgi:GTP pyrophosphokinase